MSGPEEPRQVTRVAAYALCQDDAGRILLTRLTYPEIKAGYWTLPGGGIEFGEAPVDAVLRELTEETGLTGRGDSLAGVESWVRRRRVVHPRRGRGLADRGAGRGWPARH